MKYLGLLLLLSVNSSAADYSFTKQVDHGALHKEIVAAGISFDGILCSGDNCKVLSPSASPAAVVAAHVYVDPEAVASTARTQAVALAKKLKAGTATAAEKDALLLRLCFLLLSRDQ